MVGASDGGAPKGAANAAKGKAGADSALPLTSGVVSVVPDGVISVLSDEDEEGAEETRVQAQPPNFAEIEQAFVPVGSVDLDPETNRKPKVSAAADTYDQDESVTQYGAPVERYGDDSVTTEGRPVARPRPLPRSDDTESITKRKHARPLPKLASADDDSSVRETAIIVSPVAADERPPTASPSTFPRNVVGGMRVGAGVAAARAELLDTVSDSGLRLTRDDMRDDVSNGERGTLGLGRPPVPRSELGMPGRFVPPPARLPQDLSPPAHSGVPGYGLQSPNMGPVSGDPRFGDENAPRYDVRVIIVALVSFAVPFGLFLYLYYLFEQGQGANDAPPSNVVVESPATPRDDGAPRPKAAKPASQPASDSHHRR